MAIGGMARNAVAIMQPVSATTGAAVGLTLPTGLRPTHACITFETNTVRMGAVSMLPTATVGPLLQTTTVLDWSDPSTDYWGIIQAVRFIGVGGTATIQCLFYG